MSKRYLLSLLIATVAFFLLSGCSGGSLPFLGSPTATPLPFALYDAQDVFAAFAAAGLDVTIPEEQVISGRDDPADYKERVVFEIPSIAPLGGQVITFDNADQLAAWQAYIESLRNNSNTRRSVIYVYFKNNVMLQVNSTLTNAQANEFRAAFEGMAY